MASCPHRHSRVLLCSFRYASRVEATALLVRQQQLEELVASVIAKGKAAASNN